MSTTLLIELFILLCAFLKTIIKEPKIMSVAGSNDDGYHDKTNTTGFVITIFLVLFIISAFRGDFSEDYRNYLTFYIKSNTYDFSALFIGAFDDSILLGGQMLICKLLNIITGNPIAIFFVMSFVTVYGIVKHCKDQSKIFWFSMFMFVALGYYYVSFNISRQWMVIAIIFLSADLIYNRRTVRFIILILLLTLLHKTVIVMIPLYFMLQIKWNKKTSFLASLFFSIAFVLCFVFTQQIIALAKQFMFSTYTSESYGMDVGLQITSVARPMILLFFVLYFRKKIDFTNRKEAIWFNAILLMVGISFISMRIAIFVRFSYYFMPFSLLLIPQILSRIPAKTRGLNIFVLIVLFAVYSGISLGFVDDGYYFIWS